MARIRSVKPEFYTSDQVGACTPLARLFFIGLWCHADRRGILEDRPTRLAVQLLGYDRNANPETLLEELVKAGLIVRYEAGGSKCIAIPGFLRHQKPHPKEPSSDLPRPDHVEPRPGRGKKRQALKKHGRPGQNNDEPVSGFSFGSSFGSSNPPNPPPGGDGDSQISIPISLNTPGFRAAWDKWLAHREEIGMRLKATSSKTLLKRFEGMGPGRAIEAIEFSIGNGYKGIVEPSSNGGPSRADATGSSRVRPAEGKYSKFRKDASQGPVNGPGVREADPSTNGSALAGHGGQGPAGGPQ